jgi:hypothetical protein
MRFWLSDDERRPEPAPVRADARKAAAGGTLLWTLGLVATLVFQRQLEANGLGWWALSALFGTLSGLVGLIVVQLRRRRDS